MQAFYCPDCNEELRDCVCNHDDGEGERPHRYRCRGCEVKRVCWVCGASIREQRNRCTNLACYPKCCNAGKCGGHPQS